MNNAELAKELESDRYCEADCVKLFKNGQAAHAAEYLRATAPDTAREIGIRVLEGSKRPTQLAVLTRDGGLLERPYRTYEVLLNEAGKDRNKLVRPLVEWLELGRDEHLELLRSSFSGTALRTLGEALHFEPQVFSRVWALIEPLLGETLEDQAAALLKSKHATLMTTAAFHLARLENVDLTSLGAYFGQGGRSDVLAHAFKPLLELLWKKNPEFFFDQLEETTKAAGLVTWQVPWMLDFLEPNTVMIDGGEERTVVCRADRLIVAVTGKSKKKGRLSIKRHKTPAAAEKDFEKRIAAAEIKHGAKRAEWDGISAVSVHEALANSPLEGLCAAVRSARLDDLEGLLERGANPNASVTDEWNKTLTALGCVTCPGAARRLLEAGATTGLDEALLSLLGRTNSDSSWPYLCQEACVLLIRAGADTTKSRRGWTALHVAASAGYVEVIDALLEAGQDAGALSGPKAKVPGQTALEVAEEAGRHLAAKRLSA